ncbi:hypothetical protein BdWA1_002328 [Babesia duncani]|uniref:Uncharacterized protein n=1 Tax=Babesia duncani TaxID=323732 RepID=A0AAD9PJC1_9APIC|nr:hypothetical protein BdWA1_002328 [Babesia duncani]
MQIQRETIHSITPYVSYVVSLAEEHSPTTTSFIIWNSFHVIMGTSGTSKPYINRSIQYIFITADSCTCDMKCS